MTKHIFMLPVYVGIILEKENNVLLVKRHNTDWASGLWNFPGGLLEKDETLMEAAIREANEEVGVIIEPKNLALVHVLQVRASVVNTKDILGVYFLAKVWENTAVNNERDKHADIGWFVIDELPQNSTAHAQKALAGVKGDFRYSID